VPVRSFAAALCKILPAPHFAASVFSLLAKDDLAASAATLLLMSAHAAAGSGEDEVALFVDLLPDLLDDDAAATRVEPAADRRDAAAARQAALYATSRVLATAWGCAATATALLDAAMSLGTLMAMLTIPALEHLRAPPRGGWADPAVQLWRSAAACASAAARALRPRALMALSALVAPLVDVLHGTNVFFVRLGDDAESAQHYGLEALLRRSALGALAALFDALPMFFFGLTLSRVFSSKGIFSSSLRKRVRGDPEAVAVLEAALAKISYARPPARPVRGRYGVVGPRGRRLTRPSTARMDRLRDVAGGPVAARVRDCVCTVCCVRPGRWRGGGRQCGAAGHHYETV